MIVVERDEIAHHESSGIFGSSVRTGTLMPVSWFFDAVSWEEVKDREYGDTTLHVKDKDGGLVATFKPSYWHRVYMKESVVNDSAGS